MTLAWILASLGHAAEPACVGADWFASEVCEDRTCAVSALGARCVKAVDAVHACIASSGVDSVDEAREPCRSTCVAAIGADACDADPLALSRLSWAPLATCMSVEGNWPSGWQGRDAVRKEVGPSCLADLDFLIGQCRTVTPVPDDPDAVPVPSPSATCRARCPHAWPVDACLSDWSSLVDTWSAWSTAMSPPRSHSMVEDNAGILALLGDSIPDTFGAGGLFGVLGSDFGEDADGTGGLGTLLGTQPSTAIGLGNRGDAVGGGGGSGRGMGGFGGSGAGRAPPGPPPLPTVRTITEGSFDRIVGLGGWVCVTDATTLHCFGDRVVRLPIDAPVASVAIGGPRGAAFVIWATAEALHLEPLDTNAPVPAAPKLAGVRLVGAGSAFACGATAADTWCWGANESGQLGDGSRFTRVGPVKVGGLGPVDELVAADTWACASQGGALTCWGTLYAVGYDPSGRPTSIDLPGLSNLRASAAAFCGLNAAHDVQCGHEVAPKLRGVSAFDVQDRRVCGVIDRHAICAGKAPQPVDVPARDLAVLDAGVCVIDDAALRCWGRDPTTL